MVDLSVSLTITRTELSLSTLELNDLSVYAIYRGGLAVKTGRTLTRYRAQSEATDFGTLLGATIDMMQSSIGLYIYGTASQRNTRRAALEAAFSQFTYTVVETRRGVVYNATECEPADIVYGDSGAVNEFQEIADRESVALTFWHKE